MNTNSTIQPFNFVAGVIELERQYAFERMLWRATRGNLYFRRSPDPTALLEDAIVGKESKQVVPFIACYQGDQLKSRVEKICEGFHATLYPCPKDEHERKEISKGVLSRLSDLNIILMQTRDHRNRVLAAAAKFIRIWTIKVRKIKAIYFTLNMFSVDGASKCLVAECWIPNADTDRVSEALKRANDSEISSFEPILTPMETTETRPTFHRTNKFTKGFQMLVDAYGVADYREVNPGLFTVTTFPFLFAIMFGDAGHGLIVTLFALYLIIKEEQLAKIKDEVFRIIFGGRYIIIMMGIFSIYTGLIYNDTFSRPFNIFGSAWRANISEETLQAEEMFMLDPKDEAGQYTQSPYPFGIDPVWINAENKIVFLNSFKMKLSIIIAVIHMSFGVILTLWNYVHFKKYHKILLEFVPKILFFWPLFGYLSFLMFFKWIMYGASADRTHQTDCAPSILVTFINMCMLSYGEEKVKPPVEECKTVFFFEGEKTIQIAFLLLAVCSVPVLLFGSPIVVYMERKKKSKMNALSSSVDDSEAVQVTPTSAHDEEDEMPFSDVMIYQVLDIVFFFNQEITTWAALLKTSSGWFCIGQSFPIECGHVSNRFDTF